MSKEWSTTVPTDLHQRASGTQIPPSIHDCLNALVVAFQYQLDQILERAKASEEQFETSLQDATLLTREEAAQRMRVSLATLDRKAKRNEIAATYIDSRPRFRISEIVRYLDARTQSSARRSLRRRG
jgi:excisionase family DNA binding protein